MFKKSLPVLALLSTINSFSQVIISDPAVSYTQDFNTLSSVSLENSYETLPLGWTSKEFGSNANEEYRADYGSLAGGDLYSFGDETGADSLERALGSIGSGSVYEVHYGVSFVNTSTDTIKAFTLSYTGELWRVGNADRATGEDTLHFFYDVNAGTIDNPGFTAFSDLSFTSLASFGDPRNQESVDGNSDGQNILIEQTVDVTVAPNDTLWLKWFDYNSSSYDDGLAIDDVSVAFHTDPVGESPYGEIHLFDTYYTEDFNSLDAEYSEYASFSSLPTAWFAQEFGANANDTYRVAYGDYGGGNIYSFGPEADTDRALGSIGSGSLNKSNYGSAWINKTGEVIENVEVNFTGEMWRQGRPFRATGPDTLHFSYAINATDISTGDYSNYDLLSFYSPVEDGELNVPVDGNSATYQTERSAVIGGLNLMPNDTLWIRWTDANSASYDDGLAIDDFSIAAINTADILTVEFQNQTTWVNEEDGIIALPVVLDNGNEFLSQVEVSIASYGTIDPVTDVNLVSAVVSFTEGLTQDTSYFYFEVLNSLPFEEDEYFVLQLENPSNAFLGDYIYDTVYIANYNYPLTSIEELRGVDEDGVAEPLGTNVLVEGIVHGVNFNNGGGLDFYVLDEGYGINVFNATETMAYDLQQGDAVKVWGKVGQFRGLTRLEQIDSIGLVSADNELETPQDINMVNEVTESAYLMVDSLKLYPPIATWPENLNVQAVNLATEDTLEIYISSNSNLAGESAPSGPFMIYGIGSQKSATTFAPFNDGYRLMGLTVETQSFASLATEQGEYFNVYPNPTAGNVRVEGNFNNATLTVVNIAGQTVFTAQTQQVNFVDLDLSTLQQGIYFINVQQEGIVYTTKISKK